MQSIQSIYSILCESGQITIYKHFVHTNPPPPPPQRQIQRSTEQSKQLKRQQLQTWNEISV